MKEYDFDCGCMVETRMENGIEKVRLFSIHYLGLETAIPVPQEIAKYFNSSRTWYRKKTHMEYNVHSLIQMYPNWKPEEFQQKLKEHGYVQGFCLDYAKARRDFLHQWGDEELETYFSKIPDEQLREEFIRLLHGTNVDNAWEDYEEQCLLKAAMEWCDQNQIAYYVDDLSLEYLEKDPFYRRK